MSDIPPGIDTSRPNVARMYDYWLGGKDNFAADRELGEAMAEKCPLMPQIARDNRAFLVKAAARAAGEGGVAQFIELGCGLPTSPAVHDGARSAIPSARVAYVDNDPVVHLHASALLAGPGLAAVQGDLTDPDAVLSDPALLSVIDLERPAAVILAAVLHFFPAADARRIVASYAARVVPGSWVIVSAGYVQDEAMLAGLRGLVARTGQEYCNHGPAEMAAILEGLDVVAPGVTGALRWVAGLAGPPPSARDAYMLAGCGVKKGGAARPMMPR